MYRSLEPIVVVDAPQAIVNLATSDPRVVINMRPDQWPHDVREQFKNDKEWRKAIGPHDGLLVSPMLTDFIRRTAPGMKLAILFQDTDGNIFVQVGTFHRAQTRSKFELVHYGVNAGIILEEWCRLHPARGGVTWSTSILAIAPLPPTARLAMRPDHSGQLFVSKLTQ